MDSMVMEWNINGMSMGFNSDILEYSWDIDGDIGKNNYGGYNLNYSPVNEQFTAKPWPIEFDDVLS